MKRIALLLALVSTVALASDNYQQDARELTAAAICGATNVVCQQAYISGAKDNTAAAKRVDAKYKAIRAAEVPPPPPPNLAPTANADGPYATAHNTALTLAKTSLLVNDTDPEGDPLAIVSAQGATNGSVALGADGVTFTPVSGYSGAASFAYTISDGQNSATANVAITVAAPPPSSTVPTTGLPPVADGLDVPSMLQAAWGTGAIPASAAPDVVGAFRLICQAGISNARLAEMIKYDDPIVYPGQPGKSHLHQFFGNTLSDANSTYQSLRTTGESTCGNALNRSLYWMPAMMDGKGFVVPPDYVSIYYKRRPKTSPFCNANGHKGCVDLPRGMRYIFGADMLDMAAKKTGGGYFDCQGSGAVRGHYSSITDAAKNCPIGAQLGAVIASPPCWNGVDLDSPNHRSHMAYPANPNDVNSACPATHPYLVAQFTLGAWYTTDATLDRSGAWDGTFGSWHLSSDNMPGMPMKPGTTFHTDWFGAWNDSVLAMWHGGCIDKLLNCSGADLGNGKQLKQAYPDNWVKRPRVPIPPQT